jgi:anti-sigma regulatory factor (Ser/Thr protein kinase)
VAGLAYSECRGQLTGGGSVVLFTDGVTEAMNASGDQFSERRLVDVLSQESRGVKETVDAVVAAVDWFEGDTEQSDDVTVLVLEYRGRAARAADTAETIRISNALPGISEVLDRLDVFAAKHAVPAAAVRRAKTILDDLLNNIVSYGYETPGQDEVHIRLERGADHLRISTLDHGTPFNPLEQKAPDTEAPLEERAIGGLGIHLIQTLADAISYERLDDANVLTIDIRLGEEEA